MFKVIQVHLLKNSYYSISRLHSLVYVQKRNYLSNAYYCREVWDTRLESPILKKVNLDKLYYELEQNYQHTKNISAVDVDIFVNAVIDTHLGELQDLIHKLRLSADSSNTLTSTGHATIRAFITQEKFDTLLDILDDRINYGVFLDHYDANILMNMFLKNKKYAWAAQVAVQLMLQEDFSHLLSKRFAALSCYLFLRSPSGWSSNINVEPEPQEEVKIRVKFLRNHYFDDHFDIREPFHLVGKTLTMIGNLENDCLNRTLYLIGLIMYGKKEYAIKFIQKLKNDNDSIYEEVQQILVQYDQDISNVLEGIKFESGSIEQDLIAKVNEAVNMCSEKDIAEQCKLYHNWNNNRQQAIEHQFKRLQKTQRLKELADAQEELKKKEQHLRFFENEENIDLQIEENKVFYKKKWFGKKKKPRKIDENYIPPEVRSRKE